MFKKTKNKLQLFFGAVLTSILVTVISSLLLDLFKEYPFWTSINSTLEWIYQNILGVEIKVWLILIGISVYLIIKRIVSRYQKRNSNISLPDFLNYREDKFHHFLWKWEYYKSPKGNYSIENIRPYCPKCGTKMSYRYSNAIYGFESSCPRCDFSSQQMKDESDIRLLITDNIERQNNKE